MERFAKCYQALRYIMCELNRKRLIQVKMCSVDCDRTHKTTVPNNKIVIVDKITLGLPQSLLDVLILVWSGEKKINPLQFCLKYET